MSVRVTNEEDGMVQRHGPATAEGDAQSGGRHAAHQPAEHATGHDGHRARHPDAVQAGGGAESATNGRHPADGDRAAEAPIGNADTPQGRIEALEAALEAVKAEAAQNWDKYLRERAEMENYKRRLERLQADHVKRVRRDLLVKTLNALDNLERALSYHEASTQPVDPQSLVMGLKMTLSQFKDLLSSEGLTEVKTVGEQFDPALHEAVATEVAPDKPEGEIVAELQKGYQMGDDLVRAARVKVATKG